MSRHDGDYTHEDIVGAVKLAVELGVRDVSELRLIREIVNGVEVDGGRTGPVVLLIEAIRELGGSVSA